MKLLKRILIAIVILVILGLIGKNVPDPPKHESAPETREEGIRRIAAEYGYSQDEVHKAINRFERNR